MKNQLSFNTSGFYEYLDRKNPTTRINKGFFKHHFEDIDFKELERIANEFSQEYGIKIDSRLPKVIVVPHLPDNGWIGATIFYSNGIDILLCGYSITDVVTLYSTLFHELVHSNSYIYINDMLGVNHTWFTQLINEQLYHEGIDEGMTDMLAGELFKRYCDIKSLPYIYEYSNIREIWKVKRLIVFLSRKCGYSKEGIQKILYSWYFNGIQKNEVGMWKSIYKALSDVNGEFNLTDTEIIRILDDTLN